MPQKNHQAIILLFLFVKLQYEKTNYPHVFIKFY